MIILIVWSVPIIGGNESDSCKYDLCRLCHQLIKMKKKATSSLIVIGNSKGTKIILIMCILCKLLFIIGCLVR